MQYKDLKEITIKEWDGVPFNAVVIDEEDVFVTKKDVNYLRVGRGGNLIVGFENGRWFEQYNGGRVTWKHVYPISMNRHLPKTINARMTHRQLARWLAKGNGEASWVSYVTTVFSKWSYSKEDQDREVSEGIRVRKWGSEEWIEPTTDLLEE